MPDEDPFKKSSMEQIARYSEIGFVIPAAILVGLIIGKLLDHWLHTKWIYIAGLIAGAIIGFVQMIRLAVSSNEPKP